MSPQPSADRRKKTAGVGACSAMSLPIARDIRMIEIAGAGNDTRLPKGVSAGVSSCMARLNRTLHDFCRLDTSRISATCDTKTTAPEQSPSRYKNIILISGNRRLSACPALYRSGGEGGIRIPLFAA